MTKDKLYQYKITKLLRNKNNLKFLYYSKRNSFMDLKEKLTPTVDSSLTVGCCDINTSKVLYSIRSWFEKWVG